MKPYILQIEDSPSDWKTVSMHDSYEEATEAAGKLFDNGETDDFRIFDVRCNIGTRLRAYTFQAQNCPVCGCYIRLRDMMPTYDCHGIRFRSVCPACYDKISEEKGYDGEYYSSIDECLDYDY